jgi:hypothetical protein
MVTINKMFARRSGQSVGIFSVEVDMASTQSVINAVNTSLGGGMLRSFMEHQVHPYFQDQIVDRFAYNGGRDSTWAPLKESTKRIRHAMGQYDDWAINERTGEMLEHLVGTREVNAGLSEATLSIPGDQGDEVMTKKIRTAQHGASEWNDGFGAFVDTPARPVLVVTAEDRQAVMIMLQVHIMNAVAGMHNLGPLGSL